jgi:hypothetical protein
MLPFNRGSAHFNLDTWKFFSRCFAEKNTRQLREKEKESENDNEEEKSLALRASKKKHSRSVISDRVSIAVIAARTYNKQCASSLSSGWKNDVAIDCSSGR